MAMTQSTPPLKRSYRKANERPRPDLSPQAEENRHKKKVTLRLTPELLENIDLAISSNGERDRNRWIEQAIELRLKLRELKL